MVGTDHAGTEKRICLLLTLKTNKKILIKLKYPHLFLKM